MKPKWLDRDLIRGPHIKLCMSQNEFSKELKKLGIKEHTEYLPFNHANAAAHFLENDRKEFCCFVCIGDVSYLEPLEICGIIVHESVHIFEKFCNRIGEDNPSTEFIAYSIQAISQRLMYEYARRIA